MEAFSTVKTIVEAEIEKALREGKRYNVIARELGVSAKTIAKVSKMMHELPPSRVFTMFDDGVNPRDIVKDTNADPVTILKLYQTWVDMHREEVAVMIWKRLKTLLEEEAPVGEVAETASKMTKMLEQIEKSETYKPEYWKKRLEKKGHS